MLTKKYIMPTEQVALEKMVHELNQGKIPSQDTLDYYPKVGLLALKILAILSQQNRQLSTKEIAELLPTYQIQVSRHRLYGILRVLTILELGSLTLNKQGRNCYWTYDCPASKTKLRKILGKVA